MKKTCLYTKTYTGSCDQGVYSGTDYCYYHTKVASGLIETSDPILSMRNIKS
jgi:hypothetical protein